MQFKIKHLTAIAGALLLACITPLKADPINPYVGYDYGCPDSTGDYIGNTGSTPGGGFTTCTKLPGAFAVGTPNSRSLSAATAYQATDNTKAAWVVINFSSSAVLNLSGGATNTVQIVIGPTSSVAGGTGTALENFSNGNTGTLTIGLAITQTVAVGQPFIIPAGYYFAYRVTSGTVTVSSAFDMSMG